MPTFLFGRFVRLSVLGLFAALLFSSCVSTRYYNQRTMLRLTDEDGTMLDTSKLRTAVNRTAKNYLVQPNDYLDVRLYTNKGERILDPNGYLQLGQAPTTGGGVSRSSTGGRNAQQGIRQGAGGVSSGSEFLVQADGTVTLPLLNGPVKVSGLSLLQVDSVLERSYSPYYKESFVMTRVTNNRVFLLGSPGGQVITLANDNMNLLEVLALAGGIDGAEGGSLYRYGGNASNIRIIRGDLKNPQIQQIDLTTLNGMRKANLQMEPNDVVYVEPVRRPFIEGLVDAAPILGVFSVLLSTFTVLSTIYLYTR